MADQKVRMTDYSFKALVVAADPDHYKKDVAYEFSGERKFESTDSGSSGIYEN